MAGMATSIADNPLVLQAAASADPSALLQPYALEVMDDADADFITIMAPDRTRWTHPRTEELGKPYIGSIADALDGQVFTEITAGTLGPSVRTIAPVKDADGSVKALVAAGVTVQNRGRRARRPAAGPRWPSRCALLVGGSVASWLLGRYLRRVTRGWGPEQLAQLFAYYESVLHSVREGRHPDRPQGPRGDVQRPGRRAAGARARADSGDDPADRRPGRPAAGTEPEGPVRIGPHRRTTKSTWPAPGVLVVNQGPAVGPDSPAGRQRPAVFGTVATIRDRTEIESLGSELETMRTLSDALRAQTHEHANRLHTIVSLLELGRTDEALDFATKDLELSQQLTDDIVGSVRSPC